MAGSELQGLNLMPVKFDFWGNSISKIKPDIGAHQFSK
jgi:hypothetical protein